MSRRTDSHPPSPKGFTGAGPDGFVPRLISWNTTFTCNLRCPHCYMDAGAGNRHRELSTAEGRDLIDQIAEVSRPLLIFSGGEPLLRRDIFDLAEYAAQKGLRTGIGTNGTLITREVADHLAASGVQVAAISIDSANPSRHDAFRGVQGSWAGAMAGIGACTRSGIAVQVNTTVTQNNVGEIGKILELAEQAGARSFHLFFLVPTGRGVQVTDISPAMYESMLGGVLERISRAPSLQVRPICAPQFLRIAAQKGMDLTRWGKGCLAGRTYCRIYPSGEVTPCPYLPLSLGNVRTTRFGEIWRHSPVLTALRDPRNLGGKCGRCEFRDLCGGCRARAYGLRGSVNVCGGLQEPGGAGGAYLAEEPWCPYQPQGGEA